nr:exosome complex component RRP4 homolog [Ipomoea trifida]
MQDQDSPVTILSSQNEAFMARGWKEHWNCWRSFSSKTNSNASVTVAEVIPVDHEDGVLKGHGTAEMDGRVVATLCGVVERVNKLVYVKSLRARYKPEVGDIILGRVIEVIGHFPLESILTCLLYWVIGAIVNAKINFSQDAVLMLSSMNLPDGIQAELKFLVSSMMVVCTCKLEARTRKGSAAHSFSLSSEEAETTFPSSRSVSN